MRRRTVVSVLMALCLLAVAWFYWFQYRPYSVKKKCFETIDENCSRNKQLDCSFSVRDKVFELCLQKHGL